MVKHYNPSITERALRTLNTKGDNISDEVGGLVPVIPIVPICRIVRSANRSTTGSSTVFTTPADKDFYLCGATLSAMCDATADNTNYALNVTVDGVSNSRDILRIEKLAATFALSQTLTQVFDPPIKVDRNTNITASSTFSAGNSRLSACIHGYTEETTT